MSAPISIPQRPQIECSIVQWHSDQSVSVHVKRGNQGRVYQINPCAAHLQYKRDTEMQSVAKACRELFRAEFESHGKAPHGHFTGYD